MKLGPLSIGIFELLLLLGIFILILFFGLFVEYMPGARADATAE